MSRYLESTETGDTVEFWSVNRLLVCEGKGMFAIRPDKKSTPAISAVQCVGESTGGTGVTLKLQVICVILKDPDDHPVCLLLFANPSEAANVPWPKVEEPGN